MQSMMHAWGGISNVVSFGFESFSQRNSASGFHSMTVLELACISYYYDGQAGIKISPE